MCLFARKKGKRELGRDRRRIRTFYFLSFLRARFIIHEFLTSQTRDNKRCLNRSGWRTALACIFSDFGMLQKPFPSWSRHVRTVHNITRPTRTFLPQDFKPQVWLLLRKIDPRHLPLGRCWRKEKMHFFVAVAARYHKRTVVPGATAASSAMSDEHGERRRRREKKFW